MPVYESSFEIDASAEHVWKVLTDLERYPEWNPQIPKISSNLGKDARVNLRLTLPGRPAMDVTAVIEEFQPNRLLTWRGHVVAPWLFEGYRRFALEALANSRVRFTHVEDIHGLLGPLFSLVMGRPCESSHHALNEAIRLRAESLH